MMLRSKTGEARFFLLDSGTNEVWSLDPLAFVTPRQYHKMVGHPDMILQFAHQSAALRLEKGRRNIDVHVIARAGLNGQRASLLIDPNVNLAVIPRSLLPATWILPLANSRSNPAWLLPAPTSTGM